MTYRDNIHPKCKICSTPLHYDITTNSYDSCDCIYGAKERCNACGKELDYDIVKGKFNFCNCLEEKQKEASKGYIPMAQDQVSIADTFETEIEHIINKYCGQGMTIGSAIGALQNRIFNLSLNIHLPNIIEVVKRNMK